MKTIVFINPPQVVFSDGSGCKISDLKFSPSVGTTVDQYGNRMSSTVDENCVGGVCPIK